MSDALPLKTTMRFEYGQARELQSGLRRIVANNPSPFTFKGTNTYLIGTDELALIDPGPGDPAHLDAIFAAAGKAPIKHILLTHTHHDHYEGLPALQARTGAKTAGYGYQPKSRDQRRACGQPQRSQSGRGRRQELRARYRSQGRQPARRQGLCVRSRVHAGPRP